MRGSSPLARGLPVDTTFTRPSQRIIPARAGFTAASSSALVPAADHPRSRGVYEYAAAAHWVGVGIIPARAGFTPTPEYGAGRRGDHPRSRGVYAPHSTRWARLAGSSPLARGLLSNIYSYLISIRIIPARAGFTSPLARGSLLIGDHPRSRGVYDRQSATGSQTQGSSPLARGLRGGGTWSWFLSGIIPARAGFTGERRRPAAGRQDHPRSRGVYATPEAEIGAGAGSSPLARGLLGRQSPKSKRWGDHPRSRGVY